MATERWTADRLSASLYLLLNGRIAGISGLAAAAAGLTLTATASWDWVSSADMIAGAWLAALIPQPEIVIASSPALLAAAGLIVGYRTRQGSGFTSGHGVCGFARLSFRSLAATSVFMAVAGATVFVVRRLVGVQP